MNTYSYILTFSNQMLRIDDIKSKISMLFDMGIVDIYNHILRQGNISIEPDLFT